jgi:small ubiquitin-related modifier
MDEVKDENTHINITVKTQNNESVQFKIKRTTPFKKVFKAFAEKQGKPEASLKFSFDGNRIEPDVTPNDLEMEDGDSIDAMVEQTGGC